MKRLKHICIGAYAVNVLYNEEKDKYVCTEGLEIDEEYVKDLTEDEIIVNDHMADLFMDYVTDSYDDVIREMNERIWKEMMVYCELGTTMRKALTS